MKRIVGLAACVLLGCLTPALSAVTAQQVWDSWVATAADSGLQLAAIERDTAAGLDLEDVRLQVPGPDGATFRIGRVMLKEQTDGSVLIQLPAAFPLEVIPEQPLGFRAIVFDVAAPDLAAAVRGLGDGLDFDLNATSLTLQLDEASIRRAEVKDQVSLTIALADLDLRWRQQTAATPETLDGALSLGTLHAELQLSAQNGLRLTMDLDLSALDLGLSGRSVVKSDQPAVSAESPPQTLLSALADGAFLRAEVRHGPFSLLMDGVDPIDGPLFLDLSLAGGEQLMSLDKSAAVFRSALGATRIKARLNDPSSPMQSIDGALTEYLMEASVGIGDMVSGQDWRAAFRLTGLAMPPQVWDGFDPGALLPRDPLSLAIGLSGRWALDPAALEPGWTAPSPDAPPPLSTFTAALDELLVKGLGVQVAGTGALSFDMADTATYEGMPAPSGRLSFEARGLNALIDRLSRLGVLAEEQLSAARFGLLFIGRAGAEPDSLTSEIVLDGASITLNGQKIR